MKSLLGDWFGIDPRALAAFRVGLASILLVDLAIRARDAAVFYAEGGFFPFEAARRWHGSRWNWSLHMLEGSLGFQQALLGLAAVLAVAMLIGYRTRLATIGSWVLLVSLHNRVPMLLNGGDVLFRMLIFWGMFLPLGRAWSLDAFRRRQPQKAGRGAPGSTDRLESRAPVVSAGTFALMLQLCLMYMFTGMFKYNADWLSGNSMYYVFSFDAYGRPLGRYLLDFPMLCKAITWGTLWLELVGPWLVLAPWPWLSRLADNERIAAVAPRWLRASLRFAGLAVRPLLAFAFIGLHIGIELTMTVGLFSYVSIAGWLVFLPAPFWDGTLLRSVARRLGLAKQSVPSGLASSVVPATPGHAPRRSWLSIAGWGARNTACLVLLAYVVWWNLATRAKEFTDVMPASFRQLAGALMVSQRWNMFSRPAKNDGWFVARATLADGRRVDVLRRGSPADSAKPDDVAGVFPNHRWRKFYRQLLAKNYASYRKAVAEHLGRGWNETHRGRDRAVKVELLYYRERTLLDRSKMRVVAFRLASVTLPAPNQGAPARLAAEQRRRNPP